jgi:hypothetical protein
VNLYILKGGDLSEELKDFPKATENNLSDFKEIFKQRKWFMSAEV